MSSNPELVTYNYADAELALMLSEIVFSLTPNQRVEIRAGKENIVVELQELRRRHKGVKHGDMQSTFRWVKVDSYCTDVLSKAPARPRPWMLQVARRGTPLREAHVVNVVAGLSWHSDATQAEQLAELQAVAKNFVMPTAEELDALNHVLSVAAGYNSIPAYGNEKHGAASCTQCALAEQWWRRSRGIDRMPVGGPTVACFDGVHEGCAHDPHDLNYLIQGQAADMERARLEEEWKEGR